MNIKKYEDYFHDGSIFNIENFNNELVIYMSSAAMLPEFYSEKLDLDAYNCIKGKLHIKNISKIIVNDEEIHYPLIQIHECADIIDFEIFKDRIVFKVEWINFHPDKRLPSNFSMFEIFAKSYYWENNPALVEPYHQE